MSANNPELNNFERPAYELHTLLARLGQPSSAKRLTPEQLNIADAIKKHASNASETILDGLESLGQLMVMAGTNDQYTLEHGHISSLGKLIAHLAVEAQALAIAESDMGVLISECGKRGAA